MMPDYNFLLIEAILNPTYLPQDSSCVVKSFRLELLAALKTEFRLEGVLGV